VVVKKRLGNEEEGKNLVLTYYDKKAVGKKSCREWFVVLFIGREKMKDLKWRMTI